MDFGKESQPGLARIGFPFKLEHVDSFIGNMEIFLNKLDDDIRMLPGVDKNGNSECPFAEQLYVQKEESASKVMEESKKLSPFLDIVGEEIARCGKNLKRLHEDGSALNTDEAKKNYETAKRAQQSEYDKTVSQRNLLISLTKRKDELIRRSKAKKWPLGDPKPRFPQVVTQTGGSKGFGTASPRAPDSVRPYISGPSTKTELDSLIALGPIKKNGS